MAEAEAVGFFSAASRAGLQRDRRHRAWLLANVDAARGFGRERLKSVGGAGQYRNTGRRQEQTNQQRSQCCHAGSRRRVP